MDANEDTDCLVQESPRDTYVLMECTYCGVQQEHLKSEIQSFVYPRPVCVQDWCYGEGGELIEVPDGMDFLPASMRAKTI